MVISKAYGSWVSKLTANRLAKKSLRYGHMCVDHSDLYWLESRASEKGRGVIVKCKSDGSLHEVLPNSISVRSKVHEYGSGDFLVDEGVVYFSNAGDQCIYRFNGELERLTNIATNSSEINNPSPVEYRYADYEISADKKLLVCVRETHFPNKVINELVSVDLSLTDNDNRTTVLQTGKDFYSFPRFNSEASKLCWTCWDQPEMPWDSAELWVAGFGKDNEVTSPIKIAGGILSDKKVSIYQPEWSNENTLHYISDSSGWANLYFWKDAMKNAITPIDREFSIPQWSLASSTYSITNNNEIYAVYVEKGQQYLCHIEQSNGHIEPITLPFNDFGEHLLLSNNKLYFKGAGPKVMEGIYEYNLLDKEYKLISEQTEFPLEINDISVAEAISFKVKTKNNSRSCHAFYYKPKNSNYTGLENTSPPLIVMSHGGPTGMTYNSLEPAIQFWTNRGFAVVDVNYSGSTGFGKKYKDRLIENWGILDVEDCIAAAQYLVKEKLADENALLIRGGSAGGYTTLCALTFHDVFKAGMSRYGIADLESLATDSHKFEARYLDICVGEYPKEKQKYIERSPIHYTEKLSCPILILQGADDKVVPPNQAEMMVDALKIKKLPYAYQLYKGEAHGFRKEKTIIDSLNAELSFYRQVLKIVSDEDITKLKVENLNL